MSEPIHNGAAQEAPKPASAPEQAATQDVSPTAELENRVRDLENQVKEKENKYLYLYAEFDNFKKRSIKDRSDAMKYGWEPVARELIGVLDNFERALGHVPPGTDKTLTEGLNMISTQFRGTLTKQGVQAIETAGQPFDPNLHEAVVQEPSNAPAGSIVKELTRGYTLHGRLLRPAQVVVSAGKADLS